MKHRNLFVTLALQTTLFSAHSHAQSDQAITAMLFKPKLVTSLNGASYYEAYRMMGQSYTGINPFRMAGAASSTSGARAPIWTDGEDNFSSSNILSSPSTWNVAVQARTYNGSGVGDVAGFAGTSSTVLGPYKWPQSGSAGFITGGGLSDGQCTRVNSSGRISGFLVDGGNNPGPFTVLSSTGSGTMLSTGGYSNGMAQAVSDTGVIAGWVGNGTTTGYICYWYPDSGQPSGYSAPQLITKYVEQSEYVQGVAVEVWGVHGDSEDPVIILGYETTSPGRSLRWKYGTYAQMLGRPGETLTPLQGTERSLVGPGLDGSTTPTIFLFNPTDTNAGIGLADDLDAVLIPRSGGASWVGSSTRVTGVARRPAIAEHVMGGSDMSTGKLWTAPLATGYDLSEMTAKSSNSSGPAWVDRGIEYGSTTFGMAGHADGEALRLQQYLTPDSQKPIIVRFEHTMSDTETPGTVTYRVTSRFSSTPWNLHVDLWDWTAGGGSGAWVEVMDNPLTLYMKTRDAFGVDGKYLYHDTGNGVYRMRSRLRVETTSSIITNPTRNLEIEQALFINGPSS